MTNLPSSVFEHLQLLADSGANAVHIGYPRTGCKLMQRYVLPRLGKALSNAGIVIHSAESLSGSHERDFVELPDLLHEINPELRVIITLRSQYSMLPSAYGQYIKGGGTKCFSTYLNMVIANGRFRYSALLDAYECAFGREQLFILLFERLSEDGETFVRSFLEGSGLSTEGLDIVLPRHAVNPKQTDAVLAVTRLFNKMANAPYERPQGRNFVRVKRSLHYPVQMVEKLIRVISGRREIYNADYARFAAAIFDAYGPDNCDVAIRYGLPLYRYGYPDKAMGE